ncbi:MAG: transposase [Planctomycetota bacterium]|nr:transposase [Planctomycetota bacterium]
MAYLPKSSIRGAIDYTLNQWDALTHFLTDAKAPHDKNWSEQKMRSIAIGRKHGLFIGNEKAGAHLAILHVLVLNCVALDVNPQEYLTDLVMRDPAELRENVDSYLPSTWKPPDGYIPGDYPLFPEEYLVTEIHEDPDQMP